MSRLAVAVGLVTIALAAGCPERTLSELDPTPGKVEKKVIPVNLNRNIDILPWYRMNIR